MVKFSDTGWINGILFEQWFEHHFLQYVNKHVRPASPDCTVILLLDVHKAMKLSMHWTWQLKTISR